MNKQNYSSISPCTTNDYPRLIEVWESSVRASHQFLKEEEIRFYRERILDCYFDNVSLYKLTGARAQIIVGFMGVAADRLEMLFIDPKYFRQSLGMVLLNYAKNTLGVRAVDVNEENESAKLFYMANGFREVSRTEKDGEGKNHPIISMRL